MKIRNFFLILLSLCFFSPFMSQSLAKPAGVVKSANGPYAVRFMLEDASLFDQLVSQARAAGWTKLKMEKQSGDFALTFVIVSPHRTSSDLKNLLREIDPSLKTHMVALQLIDARGRLVHSDGRPI